MTKVLRSTLLVTLTGAAAQAIALVTQSAIAQKFGAGASIDAFLAAMALPQYLVAVLVISLSMGFTPVFVERLHRGRTNDAWTLASTVVTAASLALLLLALAALCASRPLLRWIAPGLTPDALEIGASVARIVWPSIALSGALQLLTAIQQGAGRFPAPALVSIVGAAAQLALLLALAPSLGIRGLAIATSAGLAIQLLLLLSLRGMPLHLTLSWRDPALVQVARMSLSLAASSVLANLLPLLERRFASGLGDGAIAHLSYAYRIVGALVLLLSTGAATVLFPDFVRSSLSEQLTDLRESVNSAIRYLALLLLPATSLTIVLAAPLVTLAFERGRFLPADTRTVVGLLQIYAVGLVPIGLGQITGRALYALRAMKVVGLITIFELAIYIGCALLLPSLCGLSGLALAMVCSIGSGFVVSLAYVLKRAPGTPDATGASLLRSAFAALVAALAALLIQRLFEAPLPRLLSGAALGAVAYAITLRAVGSKELAVLFENVLAQRAKMR